MALLQLPDYIVPKLFPLLESIVNRPINAIEAGAYIRGKYFKLFFVVSLSYFSFLDTKAEMMQAPTLGNVLLMFTDPINPQALPRWLQATSLVDSLIQGQFSGELQLLSRYQETEDMILNSGFLQNIRPRVVATADCRPARQ